MIILLSIKDGKKTQFFLDAYSVHDVKCFHKVIPVCLCAFIPSPCQPLKSTGVVYIAGLILSTCRD